MTPQQDEFVREYMRDGRTLEKALGILQVLTDLKETDEEALAILLLLMTSTKNVIENRGPTIKLVK